MGMYPPLPTVFTKINACMFILFPFASTICLCGHCTYFFIDAGIGRIVDSRIKGIY